MQIVINIPEKAYNTLLKKQHLPYRFDVEYLIMHGAPLSEVLKEVNHEESKQTG